jgi:hypothetical protein
MEHDRNGQGPFQEKEKRPGKDGHPGLVGAGIGNQRQGFNVN